MKGILQTVVLCYTWLPFQRWLLRISAVVVIVGHFGLWTLGMASGSNFPGQASVILGGICIFMSVSLSTGALWRSLSAPRILRLMPGSRLKLLLGVLTVALSLATFVAANIALFQLEMPATAWSQASLVSIWINTLGAATGIILFFFLPPQIAVALVLVASASQNLLSRLTLVSHAMTQMVALATALAWGAFGAWYVRARRIAPAAWGGALMANSRRLMHREAATEVSRESAITAHLLGLASIPRLLLRGLLYAVPVALYVILFSAPGMGSARRADPTVPVLLVCVLMISLLPNMISTEVARRSRTLWLRGSCSREQLFRMSERLSWSALGAVGGPLLSVFIVAWVFAPHPGSNWMYMLFAMLAPGVCSVYLGLMNVSGWHPIDVIAAILVVILGCGAPIVNLAHATEDLTSRMLLLLSAQLLGALALRWVARERWQRIDWLICKPHRLSSQALRPVI